MTPKLLFPPIGIKKKISGTRFCEATSLHRSNHIVDEDTIQGLKARVSERYFALSVFLLLLCSSALALFFPLILLLLLLLLLPLCSSALALFFPLILLLILLLLLILFLLLPLCSSALPLFSRSLLPTHSPTHSHSGTGQGWQQATPARRRRAVEREQPGAAA